MSSLLRIIIAAIRLVFQYRVTNIIKIIIDHHDTIALNHYACNRNTCFNSCLLMVNGKQKLIIITKGYDIQAVQICDPIFENHPYGSIFEF